MLHWGLLVTLYVLSAQAFRLGKNAGNRAAIHKLEQKNVPKSERGSCLVLQSSSDSYIDDLTQFRSSDKKCLLGLATDSWNIG